MKFAPSAALVSTSMSSSKISQTVLGEYAVNQSQGHVDQSRNLPKEELAE
jgi:hypothetical protein